MLELARNNGKGPISVSDISINLDIPVKYLEQLIIPLKKAGLVSSVRGPKGGHMLSRPADEISLWHILTLLETKFSFVDCLMDDKVCENVTVCPIRPFWSKAFRGMQDLFRQTSLLDVLYSTEGSQRPSIQSPPD
jgi:Rrf2 family protein